MQATTARALKERRRHARRKRSSSERLAFLRGFIKHPVMVGSVIPSSRRLIDKMLGPVKWDETKLFVEYGPGVGTFTRVILDQLPEDARLVTIDTNAEFTAFLKESLDDPRLIAVTASAADIEKVLSDRGLPKADYILSGLPFSTLPPGIGPKIAAETHAALRKDGCFLVYQFSPKVRDFLTPHFNRIDRGMEWINVPPAQLFWAWKD
jgi:phospholipid N-methyltransferase